LSADKDLSAEIQPFAGVRVGCLGDFYPAIVAMRPGFRRTAVFVLLKVNWQGGTRSLPQWVDVVR
jgi:hypothetical protein